MTGGVEEIYACLNQPSCLVLYQFITLEWSWDSVFGVLSVFCAARMNNSLSLTSRGNRLFSNPQCPEGLWGAPRLLLVIQRSVLNPRQTDRSVKPTLHFSILLTTLGRAIPLFPYAPSWCGQGHVYLYLYHLLRNIVKYKILIF
jgi:hypothetical protein